MSDRAAADEALRVAVFASGGGSNFQALVDHARRATAEGGRASARSAAEVPASRARLWRPTLLVSDREGAGALDRARRAGIESAVVPVGGREAREVARDLLELLEAHEIDAVLLAGYLRLVPGEVVRRYHGRMLNIHPALLPAFGGAGMYGMRVHRAVIEAGVRVTGATVHLVDEEYDRGRILAQWPVPVLPDDTPESVAARVLAVEHRLYPRTVDHASLAWAAGREPGPVAEPGEAFRLDGARPASVARPPEAGHSTDIEREAS